MVALRVRLLALQVEVVTELMFVAASDFFALLQNQYYVVENAQPHRGGKLIEFGVDADAVDDVGVDDAEVAEQTNPGGQGIIVGDDGTTFDRVEKLGRVKTERTDIAPVEHRVVLVADAECVGAVVDHFQAMLLRDLCDCFDVAGIAENMGGDDRLSVGLYPRFDRPGIKIPGRFVDIREYRSNALPLQ